MKSAGEARLRETGRFIKLDPPVIIFGDVHLGASAEVDRKFSDFLDRCPKTITLVSIGDLVDFWAEGTGYDFGDLYPALKKFRDRPAYFLKGNRDFLIGPRWEELTGGKVLGDEMEIEIAGRKILLCHGDTLVQSDFRYRIWRRIARSGVFRRISRSAGRESARRIAEKLRRGSMKEVARKPAMELDCAAAERLRGDRDMLVCGHTHRANATGKIMTVGSWDSQAEVAYFYGDTIKFVPAYNLIEDSFSAPRRR